MSIIVWSILLRFVRAREPPSPHPIHPPPLVSQQPRSKNRTGIPPSIYNTSQGHITLLSRSSINTTAWRSGVDPATSILFAERETNVFSSIGHDVYSLNNCRGSVFYYSPFWDTLRSVSGDESEGETRRAFAPSVACTFTRWRACPSLDQESLHTGQRWIVSVWTTFFIRENYVRLLFFKTGLYMYICYIIPLTALMSLSRAFKRIWMEMCKV